MKYLLDQNVLSELSKSSPHENVEKWFQTVSDLDFTISVLSFLEAKKGIEKLRRAKSSDTRVAEARALSIEKLEDGLKGLDDEYGDRILPINTEVATIWGQMLGERERDLIDLGYAATAKFHNLTIVTRNVADLKDRGVSILDPFKSPPQYFNK